jgi:hypothetical protein
MMRGDVYDTDGQALGYVEPNGNIYRRARPRDKYIGHVETNGRVYYSGGALAGCVETNGTIWVGRDLVGYAEYRGDALQGAGSRATRVGWVESTDLFHIGGAGLLLLFEEQD